MTLLLHVWRLSEREAGHNIYPLREDKTAITAVGQQHPSSSCTLSIPESLEWLRVRAEGINHMENYNKHSWICNTPKEKIFHIKEKKINSISMRIKTKTQNIFCCTFLDLIIMSQEVCNQMTKISLWVQISHRILNYITHFRLIALCLYCNANKFKKIILYMRF